jgi:hypothetical protein
MLRFLACALSILIVGCVTARSTPYDPTPIMDHRTPTDGIRFYETEQPRCQYKEVGRVTARGDWLSSWSRVVRRMREEAHNLGGDAVIRLNESTRINGAIINRGSVSTTERNSLTGVVIRFVNPGCRE